MATGHCSYHRDTRTPGDGAHSLEKDVKEILSLQPGSSGVEGLGWRARAQANSRQWVKSIFCPGQQQAMGQDSEDCPVCTDSICRGTG